MPLGLRLEEFLGLCLRSVRFEQTHAKEMLLSIRNLTDQRPDLAILNRDPGQYFVWGVPLILTRFIDKMRPTHLEILP